MCGIVGVAGNLRLVDEKALRTMLVLDTVRGEHSTGIAAIHANNEVRVAKALGNPYELFDTRRYENAFKGQLKAIIGHNRYATQGKVSVRNAHPFLFDNVVGVHNGTVHNHRELDKGSSFEVDSEAIFSSIDEHGPFETIPKLSGAWALVYWDNTAETLNMIRNDQRPLYLATSKSGEQIYWASEPWMIEVACSKNNIAIEEPKQIVTDKLISIKIKGKGKIEPAEIHKLEGKKYTYPVNTYTPAQGGTVGKTFRFRVGETKQGNSPHVSYLDMVPENSMPGEFRLYHGHKEVTLLKKGDIVSGKVSGFTTVGNTLPSHYTISPHSLVLETMIEEEEEKYLGQHGVMMSKEEWNKKYHYCAWCSSPVFPEDNGNGFFGNHEVVCPSCVDLDDVKQYMK